MTRIPAAHTRETVRVELPWPARELHPNARVHWTKKARATNKARHQAGWAATAAKVWRVRSEAIHASFTFHPPDNRRRDIDGMLSACKPAIDGISDALRVDDSNWSIAMRKAEPVKGGKVIVELRPVDNGESVDAGILPILAGQGVVESQS